MVARYRAFIRATGLGNTLLWRFILRYDEFRLSKALVVLNSNDENVVRSAKNIPTVKTALTNTINVFDILKYDTVVIDKAAVATIEEVYA